MKNKAAYNSIQHLLPLFFKQWWLNAVCHGDWDVALVKDGTEIVAVWPYQLEKKYGFRILRNPLLTPYLGPLWISEKEKNTGWIEALWEQLPKVDFAQWSNASELEGKEFFATKKITHKEKVTYHIDLKNSEEKLWANIHPKRRNDIRKGEQDLKVVQSVWETQQFIEWQKRAFGNKGKKYAPTLAFFEKVLLQAKAEKASLSYAAIDQTNNCVAQILLVFDEHKIYYLLSGTSAAPPRGAISLLIWNALLEAKKMGLAIFDFEGSMDAGIARFFQRFGGTKMTYDEFSSTNSLLWKLKSKLIG